jgi:hypothetical protein
VTAPTMQGPVQGATQNNGAGREAQPVMLRPFKVGVQTMDEEPFDQTVTLGAGTQNLNPYNVASTAFLNALYILVENVVTSSTATATGTAGLGTLLEDGPYTVIDNLVFTDTNNAEIVGPINGYDLYVISKWGGYAFQDDPEANTDLFTSVSNATASSSAAGSFSFMLRIPVEIVPRDALGSLPNKSASTPFKVKIRAAALASIYVTSTTVGGACRFRIIPDSYWEPTPTDGSGNAIAALPPGVNTTQFWDVTPYDCTAGPLSQLLLNSVGYPVRNLGFVLRAAGVRSTGETDFPDPFTLQVQSNILLNRIKKYWKKRITEQYGYGAAGDAANGKDNGLYWHPFCADFYPKPGWENRRSYFRTTDGMRLQMKGTIGGSGAHSMTVYTNYIGVGAGSNLAALTT